MFSCVRETVERRGLKAVFVEHAREMVVISALWAIAHVQYDWFLILRLFLLGLMLGWARWGRGAGRRGLHSCFSIPTCWRPISMAAGICRRRGARGVFHLRVPHLPAWPSPPPGAGTNGMVFLIDGWSVQRHDETANQMWIRIDRGWRTSWR
jgi:hypothetical protein